MDPRLLSVEPLHSRHDKAGFLSGVPDLDRYLHTQASQDAKRSVAAPFVLLENGSAVIGYYTLSAYSIRVTDLPLDTAKKLPKYPVLPATLLGCLAVHREHQGQRLGQFLLMDALRRSAGNTREIGSIGVVVDAYNNRAELFYLHHEFVALLGHTGKLFLPMPAIRKLFAD